MPREHRVDRAFRHVPDDAIDGLTALEQNQARDTRHLILTAMLGLSSVLSLTNFALLSLAAATFSTTGLSMRHGPHHGPKSRPTPVDRASKLRHRSWTEKPRLMHSS